MTPVKKLPTKIQVKIGVTSRLTGNATSESCPKCSASRGVVAAIAATVTTLVSDKIPAIRCAPLVAGPFSPNRGASRSRAGVAIRAIPAVAANDS